MNIQEGRRLRSSRIIESETSGSDDDTAANHLDNAINLNVSRIANVTDYSGVNMDMSVFDPLSAYNQALIDINNLNATAVEGTGARAGLNEKTKTLKSSSVKKVKKTVKPRKAKAANVPVIDYAQIAIEVTKLLVSGGLLQTPSLPGGLINSNADGSIPKGRTEPETNGSKKSNRNAQPEIEIENSNENAKVTENQIAFETVNETLEIIGKQRPIDNFQEIKRHESTFNYDIDYNVGKDNPLLNFVTSLVKVYMQ